MESRARAASPSKARVPDKGADASAATPGMPVLEDLFTKAQVAHDPVLALFPRLRESPQVCATVFVGCQNTYGMRVCAVYGCLCNLFCGCECLGEIYAHAKIFACKIATGVHAHKTRHVQPVCTRLSCGLRKVGIGGDVSAVACDDARWRGACVMSGMKCDVRRCGR